MSTIQTSDVHRVVGISIEPIHFLNFVSHRITLEIEGGHEVEISAFSYVGSLPVKMLPARGTHIKEGEA